MTHTDRTAYEPDVNRIAPIVSLWRTPTPDGHERRIARFARPLLAGALLAAVAITAPLSQAESGEHKMVRAADLKWEPVGSLPKGAEATVIEGPMNKAVPFTVRIRFPANYKLPAHFHPEVERVTVLSGEFHMGLGATYDEKKTHALGVGDIMIMQPKTHHFAFTRQPTVVQLHGTGPWGITYVNPADDPRGKTQ